MSNFYCPRCGKAIIDSPGGPDHIHSCTPKEVLEFADYYHNGILDRERKSVEEEYEKWKTLIIS